MKRFIFILSFGLTACPCVAEDLSYPIQEFVKDLFENPEIQPDFRSYWTGSPDGTSARDDPNGGYLFRFEFKFKEGNDSFVFVATDRFGVGPESPPWSIYHKTPTDQWREIAQNRIFQSGSIFVHHPSRRLIRAFPPDRHDPKELRTYVIMKINEDGSLQEDSYQSDQLNEDTRELIEKMAIPIDPEIEKIPLAAYLLSPQAEWRPLSEHGMAAQSLDPADATLLASSKDLEWSQAVDLAKTLTGKPSDPLEPEPQRPHPSSGPMSAPHAPDPNRSPQAEPSPVDESPVSPQWPVVAALGLLWLLLKKRK